MKLLAPLTIGQINKALADALKTQRAIELRDGLARGLCLRTGPHGARWSLQMTVAGSPRRFRLGVYPFMSLADARKAAIEKRNALSTLYAAPGAPMTLGELVSVYATTVAGSKRSWASGEAQKRIRHVLAPILEEPLLRLDARRVQRAVDAHPSKTSAANCVRFVRPMLKWARKRGYSPVFADELEQPAGATHTRERVLSEDELRKIYSVLGVEGYGLAARLLLLTCVRLNELCQMRADEIDFAKGLWTIGRERMKAKEPHVVPLSKQASELFALALQAGKEKEEGENGGVKPFAKLTNWDRWQKQVFVKTGTSDWHRHDLRRTAATILGEKLEVEPHVIDAALAHRHLTANKVARTYNRSRYLPQVALALQGLADYLSSLERNVT